MKFKHIKQSTFFIALFAMCALMGCEKQDSAIDFGFTTVYIPQSTSLGNNSLDYLVPSGISNNTYNFNIDTPNSKVNVFLGVMRSGKAPNKAFTVNVTTQADTIQTMITNNLLSMDPDASNPVVLLSSDTYTLPATVKVPDGIDYADFNLSIDMAKLKANYSGKKAALCVVINNPSMYTLSTTNNKVIILIDVDALKLP